MVRLGLIGFGYWGPNLLRNFRGSPRFRVVGVADREPKTRQRIAALNPDLQLFADGMELIGSDLIDAVVIATPVAAHFPLAKAALEAGKHVLVEKPMCESREQAHTLVQLAESRGLTLMVDHTFLFTGAVSKIKDLFDAGELGEVSYIDSIRINLGLFQTDVNVLWDLAPHDLSIIDHIFEEEPSFVEASGFCHVNPRVPDICYLTLHYGSGRIAHLNMSWMSPVKVRRMAFGGSQKMIVWDDLDREEKIKVYDSGIKLRHPEDRNLIVPDYRVGDVHSPRVDNREALAGVVEHFADMMEGKGTPLMDGRKGLKVVSILEQAQLALDNTFDVLHDHAAKVRA